LKIAIKNTLIPYKFTQSKRDMALESKQTETPVSSMNLRSKFFLGLFIALFTISIVALSAMIVYSGSRLMVNPERVELKSTMYSSPYCGCCHQYIAYLEDLNVNVTHIKTNTSEAIKDEYQIPENLRSCHTMVLKNYIIEGHVPIEAIDKLLDESPDIDGISLPEMPSGAPGISGEKESQFDIIAFKDGESQGTFVLI
jgi:hypothetical protein